VRNFGFIHCEIIGKLHKASIITRGPDLKSKIPNGAGTPLIIKASDLDHIPMGLFRCRKSIGDYREAAGPIVPPDVLREVPLPPFNNTIDE
jgi:hypothetical protein